MMIKKQNKNYMWEEKIFFEKPVSFNGALESIVSAISDCEKTEKFDANLIAMWNANICSCSHRSVMSPFIDIPFGIKIDGSQLNLCIIDITKYGKMSLIINSPHTVNIFTYRMPYNENILGIKLEDCEYEGEMQKFLVSMCKSLRNQIKKWMD